MHQFKCLISLVLLALCGCGANGASNSSFGGIQGQDETATTDVNSGGAYPFVNKTAPRATCAEKTDSNYCIALKYVTYKNSKGTPVVTENEAHENVISINKIWSQCQINFKIDAYLAADPDTYSLTYNTANASELNVIRRTFDDSLTFLVVTTGKWDRSGTLGKHRRECLDQYARRTSHGSNHGIKRRKLSQYYCS